MTRGSSKAQVPNVVCTKLVEKGAVQIRVPRTILTAERAKPSHDAYETHDLENIRAAEKRAGHIQVPRILQTAARTKLPGDAYETHDMENARTAEDRAGQLQVPRIIQTARRTRKEQRRTKPLGDPERARKQCRTL